jgi:hypothetical protein
MRECQVPKDEIHFGAVKIGERFDADLQNNGS